jgi:hypothetical protein
MKDEDHTLQLLLDRYEFVDAETLLADFDKGVVAALKRRGVRI